MPAARDCRMQPTPRGRFVAALIAMIALATSVSAQPDTRLGPATSTLPGPFVPPPVSTNVATSLDTPSAYTRPNQSASPNQPASGAALSTRPTQPPWERGVDETRRGASQPGSQIQQTAYVEPSPLRAEPPDASDRTPISRTPISRPDGAAAAQSSASLRHIVWVAIGLLVLLAFGAGGLMKLTGRKLPTALASLPREACEVLGRRRLDARTQISLVRLDRRLLVLGIGADGVRTLAEIDDPVEIDRLAGLCRLNQSGDSGSTFGAMLFRRTGDPPSPTEDPSAPAPLNRDNFQPPAPANPSRADTPQRMRPADRSGQRLDLTTP